MSVAVLAAGGARWGRGLLAAHLLASPLVFSTGNADPFELVKAALLVVAASAAGTAALVARLGPAGSRLSGRPRDPLLVGGALFVAASAGASTLFAISPLVALRGAEGSFAGLVTLLGLAAVFAATRGVVLSGGHEQLVLGAVPVAAAGVSAYALLQLAGLDPIRWLGAASLGGAVRPFSTLGHPNHLAAWLAVASPLVLLLLLEAVREGRHARAALLALVLALSCATVLVSLSRGGWAALAGGLAVTSVAAHGKVPGPRSGKRLLAVVLCCAGLAAPILLLRSSLGAGLAERIGRVADLGARGEIWRGALRIFSARPFLGCGPDNLALAWGAERTALYRRVECDRTPARAHDDVLHLLATQGGVGFLAVSVLAFGLGRRLRVSLAANPGRSGVRSAALTGAVTAFAIQGLAGFTVIPVAVLASTVVALALREGEGPGSGEGESSRRGAARAGEEPRLRFAASFLVSGLVLGCLASSLAVRAFLADRLWRSAELVGGRSGAALELLDRARTLDPTRDVLAVALGEAARQASVVATDSPERRRLREVAEESFARATRLVPENGHGWLGAARLERDRLREGTVSPGDVDRAFDAALARDPRNASFLADAANAALEAGSLERGETLALRSAAAYPDYGPPIGQLGLVALAWGRSQEARRLLERSLGLDWCGQEAARAVTLLNAAAAAAAAGDAGAAVRWSRESLEIDPASPEARYNLARALEESGRRDEARREYRFLLEQAPGHPLARKAGGRLAAAP